MSEEIKMLEKNLKNSLKGINANDSDEFLELLHTSKLTEGEFVENFFEITSKEQDILLSSLHLNDFLNDEFGNLLCNFTAMTKMEKSDALKRIYNFSVTLQMLNDKTIKWDVNHIKWLFRLSLVKSKKISSFAAKKIINLKSNQYNDFIVALKELIQKKIIKSNLISKEIYSDLMNQLTQQKKRILAYFYNNNTSSKQAIPIDQTFSLFNEKSEIYNFIINENFRIFLAKISIEHHQWIDAAWLDLKSNDYILVVSDSLKKHDLLSRIEHEFVDHFLKEIPAMEYEHSDQDTTDYAEAQLKVNPDLKQLVAKWAIKHFKLTNGAGIVFDAGSSCLIVWEEIAHDIKDGEISHLTIHTNNLLILEQWRKEVTNPRIRDTKIKLIGWELDTEHRAFYGGTKEARERLTATKFRPWVVFIGTNGIEFDEKNGILFGYHADDAELEVKQLFFQCYARQRVILATPKKIGYTGGLLFNILEVPNLDTTAPIYLVTTIPEGEEQNNSFESARNIFQGKQFQQLIKEKGIKFHWIILKNDGTLDEDIVAPNEKIFTKNKL